MLKVCDFLSDSVHISVRQPLPTHQGINPRFCPPIFTREFTMPSSTQVIQRCAAVPEKLLPYELSYMTDEIRRKAKTELFENEDTRVNSLRLMRSMLRDEKDLKFQDEDTFLLPFLRARKFDVKRAFQLMKNFYTVMGKHDELFADFNYSLVQKTYDDNIVGFLPHRDHEGCVILVIYAANWEPEDNSLGDIMRALSCGLIHAIQSPASQVAGFKVIVDFNGFTLRHVPHVSPTYLWLFAEALQNCFPARFREIHIVNEGHLFTYIWAVLKQLLTKKLRDRFHFHGKNVRKLHKYFHPSILSKDYDGELSKFDNRDWAKTVEKSQDKIKKVMEYGYDKYRNRTKN